MKVSSSVYRLAMTTCLFACTVGLVGCPSGAMLRYRVDIDRDFQTPLEEDLILIAENTYPSREEVATQAYSPGTDPESLPENVWWYFVEGSGEFRYPYALTAGAIEYYTQKILDDRANALSGSAPVAGEKEHFEYEASIDYHATFEGEEGESFSDVYVVTMKLEWSESHGIATGSGFSQDRLVVITPSGEVLQVQGDDRVYLIMS
ncbi:MAG: hypothetical protein RBU21_17740 [FCB group bacterium]|jgi:hypothetical protein|nr:hypothetical protein [FCB group bacterium]